MKRLARQAWRTIFYAIHHTGMVFITAFLLLALAAGTLAYRFSLGPIEIPWITSNLASAVSGQGIEIGIADAALAWDGFKNGGGVPFILQLQNITARNAAGADLAEIPSARLVFLPGTFLLGTKAPILVASKNALFAGSTVPVSLLAAIQLGPGLKLSHARLKITLGEGRLGAPGYGIPVAGGLLFADISPTDIVISKGQIFLSSIGEDAPVLGLAGAGHFDQAWLGSLTVTADSMQADDMAAYWPPQLAQQARGWVTYNITHGSAHNGRFVFGLSAPRSLAALNLETVTGSFQAENLNIGWIPHAQPITGVSGSLAVSDKDSIDITATSGRLGGVALHGAQMRITGVAHPGQFAALRIPVAASLPDALKILNENPLNFLSAMPADLLTATGSMTGTVTADFPLKNDLQLQDVALNVTATIQDVTVPTPLEHMAFTNGALAVQATTSHLQILGNADFAGQPARITALARYGNVRPFVDFTMDTIAGNGLLDEFGLETDFEGDVSGVVPLRLNLQSEPGGRGIARLEADLSKTALRAPAFGWAKPAGQPGSITLTAALDGETVTGIESVTATAPGLEIQGVTNATHDVLSLSQFRIGASQATGSITAPAAAQSPWVINLTGSQLDVSAILNPPASPPKTLPPPASLASSGPLWAANLHFARLLLAGNGAPALHSLAFSGHGQGTSIAAASASASNESGQPLNLTISPGASFNASNFLHLDSADGGFLLRALGAFDNIQGGTLSLDAQYSDSGAFSGKTMMEKFRLLKAPAFAKLLQTLSIYGAAEAASGPGLEFDRLVAPFTLNNHIIQLDGARAFSKSLGFTASGSINLTAGSCDLDTTIVPAYALNAALGKIPLLGKLFTAEKGGGLFAARARITGPLSNPAISVNPLSALTPGLLRGLFGIAETPK